MGEHGPIEPSVKFEVPSELIQEGIDYYRENKKALIEAALRARDQAVSHRGFKVGCSLVAFHPDHENHFGIYSGYNNKPEEKEVKGKDKRCAERQTMEEAIEEDNCKFVSVFITVSREKSTGDENRSHDALHPCKDCRHMLRELLAEGVLNDETLFCGVNDSEGEEGTDWRVEEMKLKKLLGLYHDDFEKL